MTAVLPSSFLVTVFSVIAELKLSSPDASRSITLECEHRLAEVIGQVVRAAQGPPRTRHFQTACPPDRFGSSILSARELRKTGCFPCFHLLSTTNGCRATSEYSRRYPRKTSCTDHPIRSRYAALPVRCPASGRGETEAAAQCRIRRSPRRRSACSSTR